MANTPSVPPITPPLGTLLTHTRPLIAIEEGIGRYPLNINPSGDGELFESNVKPKYPKNLFKSFILKGF